MIPDVGASQPIPTRENMEALAPPTFEMPADTGIPGIEPLEEVRSGASWHDSFQSFSPYLLVAYTIGVGLMLARFSLSFVSSSRLLRTLQPIADSDLMKLIAEQSSRLGLRRPPIVALCERVSVPAVVGIVKPMILLPPALLCGLDPHQLAAILSHEMAHIRRYDLVVNLLQRIVEALLFFHPVTWWISGRISIERENCCDDLAAAGCGRLTYAGALLRMAELCAGIRGLKIAPQLESLAADGGNTSQLGYRIKRLLGEGHSPRIPLTRGALAAIALAAVFGGLLMVAVAQSGGRDPIEGQPTKSAKRAENSDTQLIPSTGAIFGDEPREPADSWLSPQRDRGDHSSWIPARPVEMAFSSGGTGELLEDHSVRLEGDVSWQVVDLQFAFDKPTNVQEIRLEVLPVDSPTGPQFGRGGDDLMLFDVKPSIENTTGKFTRLDFASCTYLQNPSDETAANCIDYLSDTGWKAPPLPVDATAHELVLRFEKPISLRADQRLTLTVDSGGAKELAVLNRIRFAFRQGVVGESTAITAGGANEKVEPWEISKLYEAAFLRTFLQDHETLPKPIVVPPVSGKVFDPNGNPVSGVRIVSHTPRHWVDLDATLALKPHNSGGVRNSKRDGTFGLPERTEPYRVLLVHESSVANVSHEELLRANGKVTLTKWASLSGTLKLGGKPQAGETIVLYFDTLPWSYSRGGPRLTTTHRTTTDKDGNFSFDRVPPLGGMAHHVSRAGSLGRGTVYQCESGRNTHVELGAGKTITGKLSFPEHVEKNKLKVYARNHLLPIPYPEDWTDEVNEEERRAWRIKWSSTAEGCALEDKNFILMNSNVPGAITDDGRFTVYGVPERPMVLVVAIPGKAILLEQPFDCTGSFNDEMDLGTLTVADDHDHDHDEVNQTDQSADKPQLPKLIVKTVDSDGKPVPGATVLFYDRNSHRAGQKQKFEMVNRRTDESGVADFGVMPNSFGCLQLSSSNKELADCYTLISATMTECTQARPPRANVKTEIKDGILTVTFTMTPHVELEFNIVDDATDEIVFWSEIFYQDSTTKRWWQLGLVDGSKRQHNFIPISPQITNETIRISALGYETKVFRLPDELDRSKPIRRDVRLKPMPDVELKVLLHDGVPAEKAKLTFRYPNELACLQIHEQLSDAQGIVTTKFPPSADIGIFRLEHTGGSAELSMKELLDAVKRNPGEVIQRSIPLRK
jgi:beta-lactamase regulating signal transducer with metallopeptidase domain